VQAICQPVRRFKLLISGSLQFYSKQKSHRFVQSFITFYEAMEICQYGVFWALHSGKKFNNSAFFSDKILTNLID
jgi:hypothetical protein